MSAGPDPITARSVLFVPGARPDRFDKAVASGADLVVLDLEDAVAPDEKSAARSAVVEWLATGRAAVRVNGAQSDEHAADVSALAGCPGLVAVLLPMTESVDEVRAVCAALGADVAILAQVETAVGLLRAPEVAAARGVARLAFGHLDFADDIDAAPEPEALAYARSALVIASRAAGIAGPIDSVTVDLDDASVAGRDAVHARRLGFTGKLCIHPRQVAAVNAAMSPSDDEAAWAERVIAAGSDGSAGAVRVDGAMVDAPVLARARRILARAADR